MKKIISIVLVLFMMSVSAFAEKIDFSEMTLEELFAMRSELNAEIAERTASDPMVIYVGEYVIGKDIAPGMYVIYTKDELIVGIKLFVEIRDSDQNRIAYNSLSGDEKYFLNLEGLEPGTYLNIDGVQYAYIEQVSKPEWMP